VQVFIIYEYSIKILCGREIRIIVVLSRVYTFIFFTAFHIKSVHFLYATCEYFIYVCVYVFFLYLCILCIYNIQLRTWYSYNIVIVFIVKNGCTRYTTRMHVLSISVECGERTTATAAVVLGRIRRS
jgi:hypothetical protein